MYLTLVFRFFLFFFNLSLQNLQKLVFKQHFLDCDKDFEYHLNDLAHSVFESNTIWNNDLIIDAFISIERDNIFKLIINDLKLLPDKLFKQENISIFIYIEQTINVRTNRTTNLPSICIFQAIQTVCIRVNVL